MSIEAMKRALEALEAHADIGIKSDKAIAALRTAIEQADKQEPVAWREFDGEGGYTYFAYQDNETWRDEYIKRNSEKYADWVEPLYTAAPAADDLIATYEKGFRDGAAQRQPLTDEQIIGSWEKSTGKKLPSTGPSISQLIAYTRAVEAAHGIKGEKT